MRSHRLLRCFGAGNRASCSGFTGSGCSTVSARCLTICCTPRQLARILRFVFTRCEFFPRLCPGRRRIASLRSRACATMTRSSAAAPPMLSAQHPDRRQRPAAAGRRPGRRSRGYASGLRDSHVAAEPVGRVRCLCGARFGKTVVGRRAGDRAMFHSPSRRRRPGRSWCGTSIASRPGQIAAGACATRLRYNASLDADALAALMRTRFADDIDLQLELFQSVSKAAAQRGERHLSKACGRVGSGLVETVPQSQRRRRAGRATRSMVQRASDHPWIIESRRCDGR